jgi:tetratricopeptide (TPR) repeat protein
MRPQEEYLAIQTQLDEAAELHRRGALHEAERIYRSILHQDARHFGATYFLGVAALQQRQFEAAADYLKRAIALDTMNAVVHVNYGVALKNLGRPDEALANFDRAIALDPGFAEAFFNRGNLQAMLEQANAAIASYDQALAIEPDHVDAHNNRGNLLRQLGRYEEALANFKCTTALGPDVAGFWMNRGVAEMKLNRFEDALASHSRAIGLKPGLAEAYHNRGVALREGQWLEDAVDDFDRAIALRPDFAQALNDRGIALKRLGRFDEALASYARALAIKPDDADALFNRGVAHLTLGRMAEGWRDYEHRWRGKSFSGHRPKLDAPHWTGEDLRGRSILVYDEQGIGDCLQFSRYLPWLVERGAAVSFRVRPSLHRLLRSLPGNTRFLASLRPREQFDFQCPLLSLAYRSGTEIADVPESFPYLRAEPERAARWRDKLGSAGFRIGICWQGGPSDATRNFPLSAAYPLSQIPGVRLISLQKGEGLEQLNTLPAGMHVEQLGEEFDAGPDAFLDTAAVMQSLDLIVTPDTSIAHLAGALARPTWAALKFVPDWRWLLDRRDTPWYPTFRLFRQKTLNGFAAVFEEMAEELRKQRHHP